MIVDSRALVAEGGAGAGGGGPVGKLPVKVLLVWIVAVPTATSMP